MARKTALKAPQLGMKIPNAIKAFTDNRTSTGKRPDTVLAYQCDLRYWNDYMAQKGYIFWNQIDRQDAREFVAWVREKTGWAEATQLKRLRSLKAMFNWLEADEECQDLEMHGFISAIGTLKKTPQREWVPSTDQVSQFLAAFETSTRAGIRDFTMCQLIIDCGLRNGEVGHMKMEHLARLDERMILVPKEGKTGFRIVWPTADFIKTLRRYLNRRDSYAKCDYVFCSDHGKSRLDAVRMSQTWAKYRKKARLNDEPKNKRITPHTLRHFFATTYIKNGGNLAQLQQMTGHKTLETLRIYLHLAGDQTVGEANERAGVLKAVMKAGEGKKVIKKRTEIKLK